jgi:AcrR family transcriptional regulator
MTVTRQKISQTALDLVDEEGLSALSMRRLAARLGVEAMSLYHHVRDKADLLDALEGAVLGGLHMNLRGDWRAMVGGMARALRSALLAHPNVVPLVATRPVRAPEALEPIGRAWAALTTAGFSHRDAEKIIISVGVFTIGCVLAETQGKSAEHPDSPRQAGAPEFNFGLEALLDGIAFHRRGERSEARRSDEAVPSRLPVQKKRKKK